jgi:hypothetical protein
MDLPQELPELRAATLDQVSVDWRNAIVRVSFLKRPDQVEGHSLRVHGARNVVIPRGDGASRIVREVRAEAGAGRAGVSMRLFMESGETLVIDGEGFGVDAVGG